MSSVGVPINSGKHPNMRPMSMFRDLPAVADLIELCFAESMDGDGRRYIADMRRALREHEQILSALRAGDGERAANLMCNHINAFQAEIQHMMWGKPAGTAPTLLSGQLATGPLRETSH